MDGDPGRSTADRESASSAHRGEPASGAAGSPGHVGLARMRGAAWMAANPARVAA